MIAYLQAVLSAGGGNVPMTIRHVAQDNVIMDVVELSGEVISAACTYFGVVQDAHMRIHEQVLLPSESPPDPLRTRSGPPSSPLPDPLRTVIGPEE
eukprot:1187320-Prorocentrum_minimum.AAC.3